MKHKDYALNEERKKRKGKKKQIINLTNYLKHSNYLDTWAKVWQRFFFFFLDCCMFSKQSKINLFFKMQIYIYIKLNCIYKFN